MYVQRNSDGNITLVSTEARDGCSDYLAPDAPELNAFIQAGGSADYHHLRESDLEFVRVLEDVIGLLMERGIIRITDLPKEAQNKMAERQSMRSRLNSVGLMDESGDDEEGLI